MTRLALAAGVLVVGLAAGCSAPAPKLLFSERGEISFVGSTQQRQEARSPISGLGICKW